MARCRSAVGLRRAVRLARFRSRRVRLPLALLARCLSAPAPVALARAARLLCRLALLRSVRVALCGLHLVVVAAVEATRSYQQALAARVRAAASRSRAARVQLHAAVT